MIGSVDSRLSGHKAYRTADGPRTPRRHTREGDAAVPVCVWARASVCMVGARVGAARHVGSHGWAAPGPDLTRWWVPGGGGGRYLLVGRACLLYVVIQGSGAGTGAGGTGAGSRLTSASLSTRTSLGRCASFSFGFSARERLPA